MPSEEELERLRRTIPMIDEQIRAKGMIKVADLRIFVRPETLKGPLDEGWQDRVWALVS
jgi:hypothetical protein